MTTRTTMPATVNSYPWPPAPPPLASGTADTWPPFYILSADKTLCDIARRKICPDGISFPGILSVARRAELSDSQFTAIRSAHNLFNGGSSSSVTPYDLALCDYLTLDIITQAMYIWKCGCTISAGQDGSIQLDRTGECQRRGIEQALFQHLSEFE